MKWKRLMMKMLNILFQIVSFMLVLDSCVAVKTSNKEEELKNISKTFDNLLKTYDKKLRPDAGGNATEVNVEIKISSFEEINEANMIFSVDITFRQWWYDPRLKYSSALPLNIAFNPKHVIWTPDTSFVNSKDIRSSSSGISDNVRLLIQPNGYVYFSTRLFVSAHCELDLHNYPVDTQYCPLHIESYALPASEIVYKWMENKTRGTGGIEVLSQRTSQFDVIDVAKEDFVREGAAGGFSRIIVKFIFKRRADYYIFYVYVPAVTLVILSWCCFWIKREAVPARVSLVVTTILSTILLQSSVNANMPRVSYMKSIDSFLLTNFCFIFLSLFEYVAVLNTVPHPPFTRNNATVRIWPLKGSCDTSSIANPKNDDLNSSDDVPSHGGIKIDNTRPVLTLQNNFVEPSDEQRQKNVKCTVHWIDKISRILFPISYVVYVCSYCFSLQLI